MKCFRYENLTHFFIIKSEINCLSTLKVFTFIGRVGKVKSLLWLHLDKVNNIKFLLIV